LPTNSVTYARSICRSSRAELTARPIDGWRATAPSWSKSRRSGIPARRSGRGVISLGPSWLWVEGVILLDRLSNYRRGRSEPLPVLRRWRELVSGGGHRPRRGLLPAAPSGGGCRPPGFAVWGSANNPAIIRAVPLEALRRFRVLSRRFAGDSTAPSITNPSIGDSTYSPVRARSFRLRAPRAVLRSWCFRSG